ncbi:MAG: hypothetical protein RLZZ220_2759 [Pseudomonadota bacterium]|uniref:Uncharacterized protein n=1 Tax=Zoogloea ramigera TaxID=350 RepID=A0A4Y4CT57_ZOORA|nr:hypothetical protein ZRA01_15890 [Zoogloea ramigera]
MGLVPQMRDKIRNPDNADLSFGEVGGEYPGDTECGLRRIVEFQAAAPDRIAVLGWTLTGDAAMRENVVSA